ncbi:MAG: 2-hydroxyacyl-CoA dehydratase family protein, partial [Phycisphaerae bacterium]|nr:2-hydroxyacyl-CoA dehydratase family protein [Phycisphaerae bacterium]
DPMVGPAADRAERICRDAQALGARAAVVCRIPGASHCASEGRILGRALQATLDIPVVEIEVPPFSDPLGPTIRTRIDALLEAAQSQS